ncbi:unnamed protein product, partial [Nesidiocoris tenuis]
MRKFSRRRQFSAHYGRLGIYRASVAPLWLGSRQKNRIGHNLEYTFGEFGASCMNFIRSGTQ